MIAVLAGAAGSRSRAWTLRVGTAGLHRDAARRQRRRYVRVVPLVFDVRVFLFVLAVAAASTRVRAAARAAERG